MQPGDSVVIYGDGPVGLMAALSADLKRAGQVMVGQATPSWVVSHELPLERAGEGYRHFDQRDDGWTKVLPHPNGS